MVITQSKNEHEIQNNHFIIFKILFLYLVSLQKTHNKFINNLFFSLFSNYESKITLVKERRGIQKIINDSFDILPSNILLKGESKKSIKNYSHENFKAKIAWIFNGEITSSKYKFQPLNLSSFNILKINKINCKFNGFSSLRNLDLPIDVIFLDYMSVVRSNLQNLTFPKMPLIIFCKFKNFIYSRYIDLAQLNIFTIISFDRLFYNDTSLTNLNLLSITVGEPQITNIYMFYITPLYSIMCTKIGNMQTITNNNNNLINNNYSFKYFLDNNRNISFCKIIQDIKNIIRNIKNNNNINITERKISLGIIRKICSNGLNKKNIDGNIMCGYAKRNLIYSLALITKRNNRNKFTNTIDLGKCQEKLKEQNVIQENKALYKLKINIYIDELYISNHKTEAYNNVCYPSNIENETNKPWITRKKDLTENNITLSEEDYELKYYI